MHIYGKICVYNLFDTVSDTVIFRPFGMGLTPDMVLHSAYNRIRKRAVFVLTQILTHFLCLKGYAAICTPCLR